ncbi:MAG: glycosyltransferase family 9 protein [Bryobacteraceae bacterium]
MRLLLIRPGAIGDFIVSLPALELFSAGASYTEIWTSEQNRPLARFANATRSIRETGLDLLELPDREPPAQLLDTLASFHRIVSWYGANREEFREATHRLGLPIEFFPALPTPSGIHAVDFYWLQAGGAGSESPHPRLLTGSQQPAAARAVIHPFASCVRKRWPRPQFQATAAGLSKHFSVDWCAGPEEQFPGAIRIDNLYELACWLAGARVYIGNDSGISHLAAATGVPVIVLFGPTDPAVWAPRGPSVTVLSPFHAIDPVQVIRAALEAI